MHSQNLHISEWEAITMHHPPDLAHPTLFYDSSNDTLKERDQTVAPKSQGKPNLHVPGLSFTTSTETEEYFNPVDPRSFADNLLTPDWTSFTMANSRTPEDIPASGYIHSPIDNISNVRSISNHHHLRIPHSGQLATNSNHTQQKQ
jgi:hypothetical protein